MDEETAWRDQLVAHIPSLRAFAWSISRDGSESDDLVQDTLVKAWTHRDHFEAGTNLRGWLFTILRNTFYTALARRRREVRDVDGKYAASLTVAPDQERDLTLQLLRRAIQQLPPQNREALILVGPGGLSYHEAAKICGCALGTIKSRVSRARAQLLVLMDIERPSQLDTAA